MRIPYGRQSIDESDVQAVVETLRSDFLTTGPKVGEFEDAVREYVGARHAVAIANGTAALHAACHAAGIGPGDEVITSPLTFAASANCVLYCGGTPVFADVDEATGNISPEEVERKITPRTKAILPVHYAGQPCEMDEILRIAREHGLLVIQDGAHALGADYKGRKIGSIGDMTTLSFHPVKHITTGEGGMILTDDDGLFERLSLFRTHGITRDPGRLLANEGAWYYEQQELGYNYRISDIQCALGISQMRRLDSFVERRRALAARYDRAFRDVPGVRVPFEREGCHSSWHLYVIRVERRKEVFDRLREAGIGVNVHYIPVYRHPYYRQHGYANVRCENAERIYREILSLPLYPDLTEREQDYVIEKVAEAVGR